MNREWPGYRFELVRFSPMVRIYGPRFLIWYVFRIAVRIYAVRSGSGLGLVKIYFYLTLRQPDSKRNDLSNMTKNGPKLNWLVNSYSSDNLSRFRSLILSWALSEMIIVYSDPLHYLWDCLSRDNFKKSKLQ